MYDINNAQLKLMIVKCEEAQSPTFEGESEKTGLWTRSQRIYAQLISPRAAWTKCANQCPAAVNGIKYSLRKYSLTIIIIWYRLIGICYDELIVAYIEQ